jgi:hypothetical protein
MHKLNSCFHCRRHLSLAALFITLAVASSAAQSLEPDKPAPLKTGPNRGTVDNMVGANYFYFWAGPGEVKVRVSYKSMTLFGNAMRSSLTVELYDEKKSWITQKAITSLKDASETIMPGNLKEKTKVIVALVPPSGGLVRTGGDYEVEVTGAVKFDSEQSNADPIVGVYSPKTIYENEDTAVKFSPNGTLQFASGTQGSWKVFDATGRIYTIVFGRTRVSLKLMPGRGLVDMNDPSSIVFQRTR